MVGWTAREQGVGGCCSAGPLLPGAGRVVFPGLAVVVGPGGGVAVR